MKIEVDLLLLKESAKFIFFYLRDTSPLYCDALQKPVKVTRLFFRHLAFKEKRKKDLTELAERLLIIPLVKKILAEGKMVEVREENAKIFYEIALEFSGKKYVVIAVKTPKDNLLLLSCFRRWKDKRKKPVSYSSIVKH